MFSCCLVKKIRYWLRSLTHKSLFVGLERPTRNRERFLINLIYRNEISRIIASQQHTQNKIVFSFVKYYIYSKKVWNKWFNFMFNNVNLSVEHCYDFVLQAWKLTEIFLFGLNNHIFLNKRWRLNNFSMILHLLIFSWCATILIKFENASFQLIRTFPETGVIFDPCFFSAFLCGLLSDDSADRSKNIETIDHIKVNFFFSSKSSNLYIFKFFFHYIWEHLNKKIISCRKYDTILNYLEINF